MPAPRSQRGAIGHPCCAQITIEADAPYARPLQATPPYFKPASMPRTFCAPNSLSAKSLGVCRRASDGACAAKSWPPRPRQTRQRQRAEAAWSAGFTRRPGRAEVCCPGPSATSWCCWHSTRDPGLPSLTDRAAAQVRPRWRHSTRCG